MRRIYADTAFFGQPAEAFFDDRELFCDLGVEVYLEHYPSYAFVAQEAGTIAGYIVGNPEGDGGVHRRLLARLPAILVRLLRGRYRLGRKTLRYLMDNTWAGLTGGLLEVRDERYPANLHINVAQGHRSRGLGTSLVERYLEKLRLAGVPGVHAVTSDGNPGASSLFQKLGFELLDERRTAVWKRHLGQDVTLLAYGLRL